ncbi:translocase of inner mitochondrial membrane 23 [Megachile rotundata]|uniref:translocase of inner mitochondrial membrane 23 n=1 Tax=Megachile rotundata TaxID=143995 RepID=UPI000258DCC5|nr:PREDICTED: mitochondrial import inner membrane translocase subunit Tim23 [Megachile rotundata]XP_012135006.1 PREDICTED: mitochondrial import inner membrane translocase subunit Tim23 [Megachile rotundata]XP_012135007.1 PREDICTED: mitochondrial import inner membrane translocase subunit Tim23 [Megachile rotundata]
MIDFRNDNATNNTSKYGNLNIPVTSQQGLAPLSPYLNFDPAHLPPSQPEYIFPEGAAKQRGRFELAFSQIGAACIIGAGIGGATGLYRGMKATALAGQTGKLRRTQLINHVMKSGSALANTFGIVSVMYSGFGVLLSWARGTDDSVNTLIAATGTGILFKSTTGLRKCALGGCVGLGIASLYCLWNNRDALLEMKRRNVNAA